MLFFIRQETIHMRFPKRFVNTAFGKKILMCSIFNNLTPIKNKDAIHVKESGEAVSNDDSGFALHEILNSLDIL